ncbi:Uncharacterised protein [Mycobacteroides abscessus subsp. abscessus]|nr:Uncharacterised protein [Mycobacteroides abscessus subsp. abscessus]
MNHPTVRDRSIPAAISSSLPWLSTSMPIGVSVAANSASANPNAISRISCGPA